MRVTRWVVGHHRRAGTLAAGVALLASGLTASGLPGAAGATASPGSPGSSESSGSPTPSTTTFDDCPEPFPVDELEPGLEATGLTVEQGTEADEFSATVIGVIEDGIASGIDMIIADTSSPAIERAGGIWAGMSGSPVYAEDGRLIGAVAYGLGVPSSIAGITPAADMMTLLERPRPAPRPATEVELPGRLRERVVATGEATAAEAAAGLRRLPVPVGVSGVSQQHLDETADRIEQRIPGARVHAAGAAPVDQPGSGTEIYPGSNFATAISYGDLTVSGVGTTTAVCPSGGDGGDGDGDVQALAFGHPLGALGATSMSMHPASAVYVQPDPIVGPFKLANLRGPAGTVDQDRTVGVRGLPGPVPDAAEVTSTLTSGDDGTSRSGTTLVNLQDFLASIAAEHVTAGFDRVGDFIGRGSSELRWVITGTRPSGEAFTVEMANRYVNEVDVGFFTPDELALQIDTLHRNRFEDVEITGVELTGSVSSRFRQYTLEAVLVRQPDGSYAPPPADTPIPVTPGGTLELRVVLSPYQGDGEVTEVDLALEVPADAPAGAGEARVFGGPDLEAPPAGAPGSFDELVEQLEGVTPNNAVTAALRLDGVPPTETPSVREVVDQVVTGSTAIPVEVVAPEGA